MSGGGGDPVSNALLEVFRDEVRSSSGALAQGLVALEQAPRDLSRIEPLMRAAHSIKGAARIVRIDHAVRLAHAMEDLLVAAQQARVTLDATHIDMLLAGADRLLELALATDEDFEQWMSEHQAILDELIARHVAAADPAARQVVEASAPVAAPVRFETQDTTDVRTAAAANDAVETLGTTARTSDASPPFESWRPADEPALLELFREELRSQCADFMVALAPFDRSSSQERAAPDAAQFEPLLRAAHSIKGAAKIVQVVPAVVLADAVHLLASALQDGRTIPQASQLELLREAVERLKEVGELAPDRLVAWFHDQDVRLRELIARLTAAAQDKGRRDTAADAPAAPSAPAASGVGALSTSNATAASEATTSAASEPAESVEPELLELFREEVANGCAALAEGLLSVEQKPGDAQAFEPLMRAAHSIKGAGRIVNRSVVVALSHAMEDCLVAAQHGRLRITAAEIDLLLAGTDLLQRMGKDGVDSSPEIREAADELVRRLKSVLTGQPPARAVAADASTLSLAIATPSKSAATGDSSAAPTDIASATTAATSSLAPTLASSLAPTGATASPTTPPVAPIGRRSPAGLAPPPQSPAAAAAAAGSPADAEAKQRVVRVTAQSLTRLMSLAGESLVEARWLGPFGASLQKLKKLHDHLANSLDTVAHATIGSVSSASVADARRRLAECRQQLAERLDEFEAHARQTADLNNRLYHEVIDSRMRPFADGVHGFPRLVRDLGRQLGKQVQLEITGTATPVDRDILEQLEAPLNHLLRNALDHGFETPEQRTAHGKSPMGKLKLHARHRAGMLMITVTDDGRGISEEALKRKIVARGLSTQELVETMTQRELFEFLFLPGFSTAEKVTDVSGRGVGLDVVYDMVQTVGGQVRVTSEIGRGTTFHLQLPITLSVIRAVLADIGGEPYAFPQNRLERLLRVPREQLRTIEGRQYFTIDGRNVGTVAANQILEMTNLGQPSEDRELSVILLGDENRPFGLVVDRFRGEQDLVVRPLDSRLGRVPHVSAAALMDDGTPVLILDVEDLLRGIEQLMSEGRLRRVNQPTSGRRGAKRILVVDDSITVREVQRQLLQGRGYDVTTAVDGVDGWHELQGNDFDLVISDINMPRMNGFDFVRAIKADDRFRRIPVIIVSYKDQPGDREQGLDAGANYYLTKSSFHDESLLDAVAELIGH